MANRPFLITVIGILTLLGALVFLLAGVACLALPEADVIDIFENAGMDNVADMINALGIIMIVAGLFALIVATAFLKGWTIAWYLGLILHALSVIGGIITFPVGVLSMLVSLVIIYYLFRPHVKEFFKV